MKKLLLLLLFISSFLNADYLLNIKRNYNLPSIIRCISYYDFSNDFLYFIGPRGQEMVNVIEIDSYSIEAGYYLDKADNYTCKIMTNKLSTFEINNDSLTIHNLTYLGLSNENLNFMFALSGLFISFLFLFGLFRWI